MRRTILTMLVLVAVGCAAPADEAADVPADPCPYESGGRTVSAACVDPWPLTVDEAHVACQTRGGIPTPTVRVGADRYGLTGYAVSQLRTAVELDDAVWADDDTTGAKISITALRDAALEFCD